MATNYRPLDFIEPGYRIGKDCSIWSRWRLKGNGMRHGTTSYLSDKWRKLKPTLTRNGYLRVMLKGKWYGIHRLMLMAFVGPCPPGQVCRHLDGNKTNNCLDNLRWGTRKEDGQDRVRLGTSARGERHGSAKLSDRKVKKILRLWQTEKYTQRRLACLFGITQPMIGYIVRRQCWTHL